MQLPWRIWVNNVRLIHQELLIYQNTPPQYRMYSLLDILCLCYLTFLMLLPLCGSSFKHFRVEFRGKTKYIFTFSIISLHWDGADNWSHSLWKTDTRLSFIVNIMVLIGLGHLLLAWFNLIPSWISNYTHYKVWDEIIYPFLGFNGCTIEVYDGINNSIPDFFGHVITYPWIISPHTSLVMWLILLHTGINVNPS